MSHRRVSAEGRAVADSSATKFGDDELTLSPSRVRAQANCFGASSL